MTRILGMGKNSTFKIRQKMAEKIDKGAKDNINEGNLENWYTWKI